jgi:phenylalanyl-tRNA synthetase beta chain
VFDVYRHASLGENMKSVAMSFVFSSLEGTLTDTEIDSEMSRILAALKKSCKAAIRA